MPGDQASIAETLPTDEEPHEGMMGDVGPAKAKPAPKAAQAPGEADEAAQHAVQNRTSQERRET